jgi:hypothetical protein
MSQYLPFESEPTNQKLRAESLARLNHFCVQNAQLGLKWSLKCSKWGGVLTERVGKDSVEMFVCCRWRGAGACRRTAPP